jgi:hypothetical protein
MFVRPNNNKAIWRASIFLTGYLIKKSRDSCFGGNPLIYGTLVFDVSKNAFQATKKKPHKSSKNEKNVKNNKIKINDSKNLKYSSFWTYCTYFML